MSFNGNGLYSLPAGNPVVTDTQIQSTWANSTLTDIATALSSCIVKDGQTVITADIPLSNNKLTGVKNGVADTDAATVGQMNTAIAAAVAAPAFAAYLTTGQSISASTDTKVHLDGVAFDTISCFDATTNYRYTPNVAGKYLFTGKIDFSSNATGGALKIKKNGTTVADYVWTTGSIGTAQVTALIDMNGSTDYVEMSGLLTSGGTPNFSGDSSGFPTYLHGVKVA